MNARGYAVYISQEYYGVCVKRIWSVSSCTQFSLSLHAVLVESLTRARVCEVETAAYELEGLSAEVCYSMTLSMRFSVWASCFLLVKFLSQFGASNRICGAMYHRISRR